MRHVKFIRHLAGLFTSREHTGEQIDQSEHCQAYTWEPEREHKENKSEPFHQPIDG